MIGDAQRGQPKARGGDAGHPAGIAHAIEVIASPVKDLPCPGVTLFPKKQTALAFKIIQKSFILFAQAPGIACECRAIGHQRATDRRSHRSDHLTPVDRPFSFLPCHLFPAITCQTNLFRVVADNA
ncbi:MAG: hypothetical protein WBE38_10005 [Terracidiphilus sp.]